MRFGVVTFPGSNCDADCRWVLREVMGFETESVWHEETDLAGLDAVVLPGGFSYGDYLRAGAIAATSPVMLAVRAFAARGGLVLGVCNGFQILLETGLLPGAMLPNLGARFRCEWVRVRVERTDTPFTSRYRPGEVLRMPIAHREGRYYADPATLERLEAAGCVVFRYEGENPNGSLHGIAGIRDETGNVLGLMPHPERCAEGILGGEDGRRLFESMADWIRTKRREAVWQRS
ncbi:MAG: phosphoribosylformylglycinamidine synthase subunit PurQ [Armatimonadota bacterium]|nr:phosphoribosylformylglycinamidine synthase subunit PurQ [Armatimonadota bacterium]MDR7438768.1 phosphoribosylformylglycinamidine synthase subunit PurQ [Armatimonadota bacterium]MDR7561984.1 phosphoribosylformylglycinamidine synthase subunit PurQ [Armatimonadota bacterium]MDR7568950.1 phosphoribosylformylglycinamidine synthase subunit PurQ [Armatimonadota bacterium]MDR7602577.1 phosphoribosylformylglycinamidine synthase subunit PurQ [Armatimonadota bacterium]